MSSCDLHIRLDEPGRVYRSGDVVRGKVHVMVHSASNARSVTVRQEWRTHGRGNVAKEAGLSKVVASGVRWTTGGEYEYPFELPAPPGPVTYHGSVLNVDWYLVANADIPLAFDPKGEAEMLIAAGESGALALGPLWTTPEQGPGPRVLPGAGEAAIGTLFGGIFAGIGVLVVFFAGGASLLHGNLGGICPAIFGAVFFVAGLAVIAASLRNTLAQQRVGRPDVFIEPSLVRPGEKLLVRIHLRPPASVRLETIQATLTGKEIVVSGSGSNAKTHTHLIKEDARDLPLSVLEVDAGRDIDTETRFDIPADAPPTFKASSNILDWEVKIRIAVAGWPDWVHDFPITVLPRK